MSGDRAVQELARSVALLASAVSGDRTTLSRDMLLSVSETATALGVNSTTVHRWINREVDPLPAHRPPGGGEMRVRWGDVLDWYEPVNDQRKIERIAQSAIRRLAG